MFMLVIKTINLYQFLSGVFRIHKTVVRMYPSVVFYQENYNNYIESGRLFVILTRLREVKNQNQDKK